MAKTAHTPGPWHVVPPTRAEHRWVIGTRDESSVASCEPIGPWVSNEEADANARLIAAAPDMADALPELLKLIRRAQDRLTEYLCPEGSNDADECLNDMLEMFDGPEQRRVEQMARAALSRALNGDA
jgi:hypothetical protein